MNMTAKQRETDLHKLHEFVWRYGFRTLLRQLRTIAETERQVAEKKGWKDKAAEYEFHVAQLSSLIME
jgi:hypothetical protein